VLIRTLGQQILDPAQIAKPLFSDATHEQNIVAVTDFGGVHCTDEGQHDGEPMTVVRDTGTVKARSLSGDCQVSIARKRDVQMSDNGNHAVALTAAANARYVALFINANLGKPVGVEHVTE